MFNSFSHSSYLEIVLPSILSKKNNPTKIKTFYLFADEICYGNSDKVNKRNMMLILKQCRSPSLMLIRQVRIYNELKYGACGFKSCKLRKRKEKRILERIRSKASMLSCH